MRFYLTRYTVQYLRSLTYMLQASEYHVSEYLAWFHRTQDFLHVEKRKRLVWTGKSLAVQTALAFLAFLALAVGAYGIFYAPLLSVTVLIAYPYMLGYGAALVAFLLRTVQAPFERRALHEMRTKLKAHSAVKIAIAGSYGKTTMRELLRAVLGEGKRVAAPGGSINTPLGIHAFVSTLTGDEEVLIFECGEYYPGDVRALALAIDPDIGVITGINEAHLEKFKTVERAADTIFELADVLGGKPLYLNGDNTIVRARAYTRSGVILYDNSGAGSVYVVQASTGLHGTDLTLDVHGARMVAHSGLLGLHQIGPLCVAADIALRLGLSTSEIHKGIESTRSFDHRMAPRVEAGVTYIDDSYNGNPDGVRALLAFVQELEGARVWYVTPGLVEMGVRTKEVHEDIGRQLAAAKVHAVVLMKNSVTPHIEAGLKAAGYAGVIQWFDAPLKAYAALPLMTLPGDTVVLQNDWPDQYA